jgi:hypothetical protein
MSVFAGLFAGVAAASTGRAVAYFGDVFCTEDESEAARLQVARMNTLFTSKGSPARHAANVAAISAEWNAWANEGWWEHRAKGFDPDCRGKEIGQRAADVEAAIATDAGLAAPPKSPQLQPGPSGELVDTVKTIAVVAALAYVGKEFVLPLFERKKARA